MTRPWRRRSHVWIPGAFLLVAGLLGLLAAQRGGWAWLLLWPAADCAAVAAAYFGPGARVFGKRRDGSLAPWASLAMLPFIAVLRLVWRLQAGVSPEPCCDEVSPGLFVGRRPLPGEHPAGISLVVDLTAEFSKPRYHPLSAGYLCLPALDAFVPDEAASEPAVERALAAPSVFVHCANGHGRSAAFAAALLLRKGLAADVAEAMALIRRARPVCRINPAQEAWVLRRLRRP